MTVMKRRIIKYIYIMISVVLLVPQCATYAAGASSPTLLYLTANPALLSLTEGKSASVTVSGAYTDGGVKILTNCIWTSSDTSVATVSKGKITGVSEGAATITAQIDSISVNIKVTVNSASSVTLSYLSASSESISIKQGGSQSITIKGVYSDGSFEALTSKCKWTSSDAAIAAVSNGTIKGLDSGTAVVTASIGSKNVLIEVEVYSPANAWITSWKASADAVSVAPGKTKAISINATFSDNSKKNITSEFVWTSDDSSIATVLKGKITGVAPGVTYVTAAYGLKSVAIKVTVSEASELLYLSVNTDYITLSEGQSQSVTVTGTFKDDSKKNLTSKCTWTSAASALASVSNGKITGISAGKLLVRAEYESKSVSVVVTVTAAPEVELLSLNASAVSLSLAQGKSKTVTINGVYSDGTKKNITSECSWTSGKRSVAVVSSGNITGIAGGKTIITATYDSKSVEIEVTVTEVPKLTSLKASQKYIYIGKGESGSIAITGTYSDGSQKNLTSGCNWKSANASVLTVSKGVIKGKDYGTTTVSAEIDSQSVDIEVTVLHPSDSSVKLLSLSGLTSITLGKGKSVYMTINGIYTNGTVMSLESKCTWRSNNTNVATVKDGIITGMAAGTATITAFYGSRSLDITVTVLPSSESPLSISASPSSITVAKGKTKSVSVSGEFKDG